MNTKSKIVSLADAQIQRAHWKEANKKVVFTNGCFDIVHLGHVDYLEKAREKGDFLILGLNSDASVTRLKGGNRPIVPVYARARLLASLAFVDMVVVFEEDTPLNLIQNLCPDILTKGSDYEIKNIVGADFVLQHGGEVATLDLVEGFSTSMIVEKIRKFGA